MPASDQPLINSIHGLLHSVLARVFRQAVAKVVFAANLPDGNAATSNLVLEPELTELDVPDFAKASATGDSLCCG